MSSSPANRVASGRPALSFGRKLTLAIVLVMAGVCISALLVLRWQIERDYQGYLRNNFEQQVELFFEKQDARVASAREALQVGVGHNPRQLASLKSADVAGVRQHLYEDLDFQLKPLAPFESGVVGDFSYFYRVFDAEGQYLPPAGSSGVNATSGLREDELASALMPFVSAVRARAGTTKDTVNYTVLGDAAHAAAFQLTTMPIIDRVGNEEVGYLVFGMSLDPKRYFGGGASDQKNALLFSDHLVSDSMDKSMALPLAQFIRDKGLAADGAEYPVNGQSYMLFFRRLHNNDLFPAWVTLYSLGGMQYLTQGITYVMIGTMVLSLLVGMLIAGFVSRHFTQPIENLARAAEAVGAGDLSTRVPVHSRDEVGRLSAAFNLMTADLAVKEKYRNVLDRVTDHEVAERLVSGELSMGGEIRTVSVLFCDIRGFSSMTDGMPPTQVIELLNAHMTTLTAVVHRHHGVVDKFVGDAVMVIFGAPKSYGGDARDAAACALEMVAERRRLNAMSGGFIQVGIGVATGRVLAGCMGSADRLNYTVLGDRVNLASRLCSRAAAGEILIDENTCSAIGEGIAEVEPLAESLALKGFAKPVPVFHLRARRVTVTA